MIDMAFIIYLLITNINGDSLGKNWMSYLDDSIIVQDLNIPGTHESAAIKGFGLKEHYVQCNTMTITEQLNIGIRSFDIRVQPNNLKAPTLLKIHHGGKSMAATYGNHGTGAIAEKEGRSQPDIEKQFIDFLGAPKSSRECIIVKMKNECHGAGKLDTKNADDCKQPIHDMLTKVIRANDALYYQAPTDSSIRPIPLGDCRGKIILILQKIDNHFGDRKEIRVFGNNAMFNRGDHEKYLDGTLKWITVNYNTHWTDQGVVNRFGAWKDRVGRTINKQLLPTTGIATAPSDFQDTSNHFIQNSFSSNSAGTGGVGQTDPTGYSGHRGSPKNWNKILKPNVAKWLMDVIYQRIHKGDPEFSKDLYMPKSYQGSRVNYKTGIIGMDFADNLSYLVFLSNYQWWDSIETTKTFENYNLFISAQRILETFKNGEYEKHVIKCSSTESSCYGDESTGSAFSDKRESKERIAERWRAIKREKERLEGNMDALVRKWQSMSAHKSPKNYYDYYANFYHDNLRRKRMKKK